MAARLELRTNYMNHRHRLSATRSGKFSTKAPLNFPHRNGKEGKGQDEFAGNCYEKPISSFDADDPTNQKAEPRQRQRPGWDESLTVTHGLAPRRPQSAAAVAQRRRAAAARSGGGGGGGSMDQSGSRPRPTSASGTFGVSSFQGPPASPAGWGVDESSMHESPPLPSQPQQIDPMWQPQQQALPQQAPPPQSIDLTPAQSKAFVEFVSLLTEVEGSGGMSMVHLAQAAVDNATAQLRRGGGGAP